MIAFEIIILVLSVYSGISCLLLMFPRILFKKKNKLKLPQPPTSLNKYIHAHRGGGAFEIIESTIESFQHSEKIGVHLVECDIQMTKDKVLIAFHDDDFLRTCGLNQRVNQTNFNDLPHPKSPIPIWFSYGESYVFTTEIKPQIVSLQQVFETLPVTTVVMLELKDSQDPEARNQLIGLIKRYNRWSTTIIGTESSKNNAQMVKLCREQLVEVPFFMPQGKVILYFILYIFGMLPFVPINEDVASLPYMSNQYAWAKWKQERSFFTLLYIPITWIMSHLCDPMIRHFNLRGIYTNYYVINEEDDIKIVLQTTSIQGIMTDKPTLALNVLKRLNLN
ncbi:glycerophosphodiester phosphodiesterase domain-containing protein 3 [Stylonychia lemnae]|uniref:Glycerophosphodiester phosphodiesterase domain-containing protein 3 n=1 Tax=Stylonychia lemnae TaxID=5949 RepID=A0A077ZUR7_STYLE|nr:glycerophosphodiester phosphodiesterase domain-containing protein 3 [Stylonychia lemnae]|eukprot:CDW73050.1 glycerophosphodiester phosphodiesterase domain-containing protein 3 [Stylonychia lemnae]